MGAIDLTMKAYCRTSFLPGADLALAFGWRSEGPRVHVHEPSLDRKNIGVACIKSI